MRWILAAAEVGPFVPKIGKRTCKRWGRNRGEGLREESAVIMLYLEGGRDPSFGHSIAIIRGEGKYREEWPTKAY